MKEILIIKTSESKKIKELLEEKNINYQLVYDDFLADKDLSVEEEEVYRRDMRLAKQDKERQKEIELWDKIQDQDNIKLKTNNDNDWDWS